MPLLSQQHRRRAGNTLVLLLIPLLWVGCATSRPTSRTAPNPQDDQQASGLIAAASDTGVIQIGDSVVVTVWGYQEFSARTLVKRTGTISLPMLGEQLAVGLTRGEMVLRLQRRLAEYIKGEIKILLEIIHPSGRITVVGSVVRPGSFPSTLDLALLEVIANAGGWTKEADLRYVRINRIAPQGTEESTVEIDLDNVLRTGGVASLPLVHPGDIVLVPEKENAIRTVSDFLRDAFVLLALFTILR